jgi:PLP dependent protein
LDKIAMLPGLQVKGLMTIGPLSSDEREVRASFARLRKLQEKSKLNHPELDFSILSMGMSQDFIWAIEEGSTQVRIGTAIFGNRSYA